MILVLLFCLAVSIINLQLLEMCKRIGVNQTALSIAKFSTECSLGLSFGMLIGHTIKILVF